MQYLSRVPPKPKPPPKLKLAGAQRGTKRLKQRGVRMLAHQFEPRYWSRSVARSMRRAFCISTTELGDLAGISAWNLLAWEDCRWRAPPDFGDKVRLALRQLVLSRARQFADDLAAAHALEPPAPR